MTLKTLSEADYQAFLDSLTECSAFQRPEMAKLLTKRGYQTEFVGLEAEGDIQVAGLLYKIPMTGGLHMEINSGPARRDAKYLKAFYHALQDYAKANGALELLVKPYDTYQSFNSDGEPISPENAELIIDFTDLGYSHDGLMTGYPGGEPDWHYVKDLTGLTADTLLKSFSKKGRPLVKKAMSFGTKVRRLERDELHLFKEITASTSDRREYNDKSLEYYQDFYDSFGDKCEFVVATINFKTYTEKLEASKQALKNKISQLDKTHENNADSCKYKKQRQELLNQIETFDKRIQEGMDLIKEHGNKDVIMCGSLFIYTKQEAVYLFSGSYTEFNKFYAPAVLQEYVMQEAIKRGIACYNFLGIQGIFDGSDGVLRFKQNFNGHIVRKMGTFRYYPKPLRYKTIQGLKKVLGRS